MVSLPVVHALALVAVLKELQVVHVQAVGGAADLDAVLMRPAAKGTGTHGRQAAHAAGHGAQGPGVSRSFWASVRAASMPVWSPVPLA